MIPAGYVVFVGNGFLNTQHNGMPYLRTSAYPTLAVFHH
jgi:hypothetical protein